MSVHIEKVGWFFMLALLLLGGWLIMQGINGIIDGTPDKPKAIVFAGRIAQANQQRWLNNRLVLAYVQDVEVGRALTQVAAFRKVLESPTDGVFSVSLDNTYAVRMADISDCKSKDFAYKVVYCWLGDFTEDAGGISVNVSQKRLNYAVRILPGDYNTLPEEMREAGITGLSEGNIIILPTKQKPPGWLDRLLSRVHQPSMENVPSLVKGVQYEPEPEIVDVPSQSATATLDNCRGNETVRQSFTDGKTFVHEYVLQGSLNLDVPIQTIQLQLGAQGSYRQKQISTKTIKYEIAAKPGTNVSYRIHLQEVWRKGVALVQGKRGTTKVPFRVQTDLKYFVKTDATNCATRL